MVELDLYILDGGGGGASHQQAGECGAGDGCTKRRRDEIVGGLGLELAGARSPRKRSDLSVGVAGAEKNGSARAGAPTSDVDRPTNAALAAREKVMVMALRSSMKGNHADAV